MIRRLACVSALVVTLVALHIPSAGAATSADSWAPKFCGAITKWQNAIQKNASEVDDVVALGANSDLSSLRETFVGFLESDVKATKAAIASIKKAGTPDVTNGAKIQKKIIAGLQSTSSSFAGAKRDAEAVSTDDEATFVTDVATISTNLASVTDGFITAVSDAQALDTDNEIGTAFAKAKACKALS